LRNIAYSMLVAVVLILWGLGRRRPVPATPSEREITTDLSRHLICRWRRCMSVKQRHELSTTSAPENNGAWGHSCAGQRRQVRHRRPRHHELRRGVRTLPPSRGGTAMSPKAFQVTGERLRVTLRHSRIHATDCVECQPAADGSIILMGTSNGGDLDDAPRQRLLHIAERCRIHTLTRKSISQHRCSDSLACPD
jgi:hypothetical protein